MGALLADEQYLTALSYALHVAATDGDPNTPRAGVTEITIHLDGQQVHNV